jgi:hypothetical protein
MGTSTHVKSQAMAQQLARRMRMRARLREGSMHRRSPSNGSLSLYCRGAVLLFFQLTCGLLPAFVLFGHARQLRPSRVNWNLSSEQKIEMEKQRLF